MTRARRAMTLVEVVVFGGVMLLVVAGAWSFLRDSLRRGTSAETKLEGVQSALLLAIRLERDMEALYEGEGVEPPALEVTTTGAQLRFHRFTEDRQEARWGALEVVPVTYQFLVENQRVLRQVGGAAPEVLPGYFERLSFRHAPNGGAPAVPGALPEAPALVYSVAAASREVLERPEPRREGRDRTVLVGAVPLEIRARRSNYPFWNPVPYGTEVTVRP